jgi:hypothetical protein
VDRDFLGKLVEESETVGIAKIAESAKKSKLKKPEDCWRVSIWILWQSWHSWQSV